MLLHAIFFILLALAAIWDALTRTCPNIFSFLLACAGCGCALIGAGPGGFLSRLVLAVVVLVALVAFELIWRMHFGRSGLGMGDSKVLFGAMLLHPGAALAAFSVGLLALAAWCACTKRSSAPVLPFFAPCMLVAYLAFKFYELS